METAAEEFPDLVLKARVREAPSALSRKPHQAHGVERKLQYAEGGEGAFNEREEGDGHLRGPALTGSRRWKPEDGGECPRCAKRK